MNIILFGVQGSGKGTQAKLLTEKTGLAHINVGDIFRMNVKNKTELGKTVLEYMNRGDLIPDKYVLGMVKNALNEAKNGFILDGFPRNPEQGTFLLENFSIDKIVLLDLDDEVAKKRLLARRICNNCKKDYNMLYNPPKKEGVCDVCGGEVVRRKDDNEEDAFKNIMNIFEGGNYWR